MQPPQVMLEFRTRLRRLLRGPSYLVAVVLSLGLGTSICLAVFSLVNALVFNQLPGISERRGLIRVDWTTRDSLLTSSEFEELESQRIQSFTTVAAQGTSFLPIMLPAGPETRSVAFVSPRFFETLGTRPVIGRLLANGDAVGNAPPVALLSERLWRSAFNGSPDIRGRGLVVGGRAFTTVGVTPDGFAGLRLMDVGDRDTDYPDVWICLRDARLWPTTAQPNLPWLFAAGRLPDDSSLKGARAELDLLAKRIAIASSPPAATARQRASLRVFRGGLDWRDEPGQSLLTIALFLFIPLSVLAIGCVNVINLQLARAMEEASELSLRLALGASRARIMYLLLLEVACLAALSGGLGFLGARVFLLRIGAHFPAPLAIDASGVAFAAVLVLGVVCVAGVLPAWQSSRDIVASGLRELHDPSKRGLRLRGALVVVQVSASVALLALSGLAVRSLIARAPAVGPDAPHILTADFDFTPVRPAGARPGLFIDSVLEHLSHASSVRAAAFSTFVTGGASLRYWRISDSPQVERVAYGGFVTPQWFTAMGTTFLAGNATPRFAAGSAVVNSALASVLGEGRTDRVIGMPLRVRSGQPVEIVGVVPDTQWTGDGTALPMLFLPMPAVVPSTISIVVLATDVATARHAVQAAVTAADPAVPLGRLESLDARISEMSSGYRELTSIAAGIGLLSLALAGAGLHSLLSYIVGRRTREIGIRVALGARTNEIVRLVLTPVLWLVSTGAVAGIAAAVPIAAVIRSALPGVFPLDPRGLLPGVGILLCVAVVAAIGPAYHAVRVDPIDALRET